MKKPNVLSSHFLGLLPQPQSENTLCKRGREKYGKLRQHWTKALDKAGPLKIVRMPKDQALTSATLLVSSPATQVLSR
jgi:hypothetical protein